MSIFSFLFKEQNLPDEIQIMDREAYKEAISKGKVQLVDVRTKGEFMSGHIKGAKNIDFFQGSAFETAFSKLRKDVPVYIYCQSGNRSQKAARRLVDLGFTKVYDLRGGYSSWSH
ncbi:Rhodanese-related sulfurtransferase [Flagellimonas taeanensis]|jgi:rhodanese-related sulfurtransferase|uniref:Rhodanese-related sulfurtransferase n=1 Tax=Flagellimonas taeanensis TaxID=1005926 RepID=A0A1M6Y6K0_9FLAO|nr:rhodanese-like domain-containing protein [Allomuricauda taeanensis]SFC05969.1 Rhodanese-related sulfurtransferase [Allomuricauda taeanensis]SHL13798.1 Rhodanese-related sulfurtransferase [Allomuricauda taeanensis]